MDGPNNKHHLTGRKPDISTGHHTPSLKRKDRHTTEVALPLSGGRESDTTG